LTTQAAMLLPENERERLEALDKYRILDTPATAEFEPLTQLAADLCQTPVALISLVDGEREWYMSKIGINQSEVPRNVGFGGHTIGQSDIFIIPDTLQDERFATNPLVISHPYYRSYGGVPLITSSGYALGTLCVIDFVPRHFSLQEQTVLKRLAQQAVRYLEEHRQKFFACSQQHFNLLFAKHPNPLWIYDKQTLQFLDVNAVTVVHYGYSRAEFLQMQITDILPQKDVPIFLGYLAEKYNSFNFSGEWQHLCKDGKIIDVEIFTNTIDYGGHNACLVHVHDITERKNLEAKLQEQNQLLRNIFENIPLMIAMMNVKGQLQWVNQEWERIIGWNLQDCQTYNILEVLYPDPEYRQYVVNFIQSAQRIWGDLRTHIRDGRVLDTSWTNVHLPSGHIIGIGQDITARKQTERSLKAQAEREHLMRTVSQRIRRSLKLQDILDASVQEVRDLLGVDRVVVYQFAADMSGTVVAEAVEPGWTVSLGAKIHDTCFQSGGGQDYRQGKTRAIANIYTAGLTDCHLQLLEQFEVKANLIVPILIEVQGENHGSHLWGLLVAHQCTGPYEWEAYQLELLDQLTVQIAIAIQQSSIFQQAQNELAERQKAEVSLRSALAEKEVLLKEIHHRVKNNLQIVSGLLELQSQTLKDSEVIKTLKETQNRVQSISLIHKNLYTSPNIGQLDVADYINSLATSLLISYQIIPGKIGLETHIDSISLNVDQAIACGLIINELISNALKYAFLEQQSGKIFISLHKLNNHIKMTVRDNGVGLSDDIDWKNSCSLGLSLVYDLVTEQLDGTIVVEKNHGTVFKIEFPNLHSQD
jgi:PAS domain S-box-containing protein